MKNNKLTFFENIYYWLWHYLPKPQQWYSDKPAPYISFLFSVLRAFNGIFVFFLLLVVFPTFANTLLNFCKENIIILVVIVLVLAHIVISSDEKNYEKRIDTIIEKIEKLTPKQRKVRIVIFVFYVILSIGIMFLIPTLLNISHSK